MTIEYLRKKGLMISIIYYDCCNKNLGEVKYKRNIKQKASKCYSKGYKK